MIFARVAMAAVTWAAVVVAIGAGGSGPATSIAARDLVTRRAAEADAALAELDAALAVGLDHARVGAAGAVAGSDPPGPPLREAAADLAAAVPLAGRARSALDDLGAALRARDPSTNAVPTSAPGSEVASIAEQLRATADAADTFARMRALAEGLTGQLGTTLVAIEARRLDAARDLLATARADHDRLAAWEVGVVTLPVWLATTGEMLDAVEQLLAAVEDGDGQAAEDAAERLAALEADAAPADRALRIALGEGGAAVTAAPLGRLAAVLRGVADARLAVASILQSVGR